MILLVIIVAIGLLSFSLLHRPLIQLSQIATNIAHDVAVDVENGLRAATEAVRNWWRKNFARVTLPAFLGGLLLLSFILAFVIADYTLLTMSISSLFPLEAAHSRIFGLTLDPAGQTAIAIVAGELLCGFLFFELLGVSEFMPWDQGWTSRLRRIVAVVAVAGLILLACISAGMAAWRTNQMQQIRLMESAEMSSESFDISGDSSYLSDDPGSLSYKPLTIKPSFLDRLPTPVAAAVGLIVSFAAAVAGIGIYWFLLGLCGILSAIFVILPMLIITWLAGLLARLLDSLQLVAASLLRLLAVPARIGTRYLPVQEKIDDDSLIPLNTSGMSNKPDKSQQPRRDSRQNDNQRGDGENTSDTPNENSDRVEETVSYTRDLEEEVAEYRMRDMRRSHTNTTNPLGIDNTPVATQTDEEDDS